MKEDGGRRAKHGTRGAGRQGDIRVCGDGARAHGLGERGCNDRQREIGGHPASALSNSDAHPHYPGHPARLQTPPRTPVARRFTRRFEIEAGVESGLSEERGERLRHSHQC